MVLDLLAALTAAALLARVPAQVDPAALQTADIVLHSSRTTQAKVVMLATASPYAHVGLVERVGDRVFVIEAVQPVKRTPWAAWRRRGLGGRVTVLRHRGLDDAARTSVITAAKRHLGRPYDLYFAPGEDRIYCSELVRLAHAAIAINLGESTPAAALGLHTAPVQALLRQRWRAHPSCAGAPDLAACTPALGRLEIVTPVSLRRDRQLTLVASDYPAALR